MLIDQFTEEQIAIIKRELKEISGRSKGTAGRVISDKVDQIFDHKTYGNVGLYPYHKTAEAIVCIINHTLDNFVYRQSNGKEKPNGKRYSMGWYINTVIPESMYDEYMEMADEIIEVIKKHRKQKEFPLKTPAAK